MALAKDLSEYDSNGYGRIIHTEDSDNLAALAANGRPDPESDGRQLVRAYVDMFWNRLNNRMTLTNGATYTVTIGQMEPGPAGSYEGTVVTLYDQIGRKWEDFNPNDITSVKLGKRRDF